MIAILSLAGMLGLSDLSRGVYLVSYALLAGAIALFLAVSAIVRARRDATARPRGAVTATVIASIGIALSGVLLVAFVVLSQQLSTYSNCLAGASTISSQQACQDQFTHAVSKKIPALQAGRGR
jgi:hypothetical protein